MILYVLIAILDFYVEDRVTIAENLFAFAPCTISKGFAPPTICSVIFIRAIHASLSTCMFEKWMVNCIDSMGAIVTYVRSTQHK